LVALSPLAGSCGQGLPPFLGTYPCLVDKVGRTPAFVRASPAQSSRAAAASNKRDEVCGEMCVEWRAHLPRGLALGISPTPG
jgi:hypothetical protein